MNVTIVDYQSGNISSVINSFTEVAKGKVNIEVTSDIKKIKSSDKIVLPGQGSFKSCVDSLNSINELVDTLKEFAIIEKKPLLGICVGLQMFADVGYEESETKGLGWISGEVSKIDNQNKKFKLPHIGWNEIEIQKKVSYLKVLKINLICILCIVMNLFLKTNQLFQLQQTIHPKLFVQLRKTICLVHNFTQRKVTKLD